jgi:hypothetical protein
MIRRVDAEGHITAEILGVAPDRAAGLIDVPVPGDLVRPRWNGGAWEESASSAQVESHRRAHLADLLVHLDQEAETLRAAVAPAAQSVLYFEKARQARAVLAGEADTPLLDAEAAALEIDRADVARNVLTRHAAWLADLGRLEAARVAAKKQLRSAGAADLREAFEAARQRLHGLPIEAGESGPPDPPEKTAPRPTKPAKRR